MKKLIINEKNLPKISKISDSSIRIRINKNQNNHDPVSSPKSVPAILQEIDACLQTLQKCNNGNLTLYEDMAMLISQLLKQYKHVLNPNTELMSQSLKFNKLKLRNGQDSDDKENLLILSRVEKTSKEVAVSDRISRLADKSQVVQANNKSQKNRKLVSMHKKHSLRLETVNDQNERHQVLVRDGSSKEENQSLVQSGENKVDQDKGGELLPENLDESMVIDEETEGFQEPRIKYLEEKVVMLTRSVEQKTQQIGELQERIEQLGANVQNLIKKNSQKAEEYNKLQEENEALRHKLDRLSINTDTALNIQQLKNKCRQIQQEKQAILKKKNSLQNQLKSLSTSKQDKIQQELGRYETAQHFYELARSDLRQENQNLMHLLKERQQQLANLYQVIGFNSNVSLNTAVSKFSTRELLAA